MLDESVLVCRFGGVWGMYSKFWPSFLDGRFPVHTIFFSAGGLPGAGGGVVLIRKAVIEAWEVRSLEARR